MMAPKILVPQKYSGNLGKGSALLVWYSNTHATIIYVVAKSNAILGHPLQCYLVGPSLHFVAVDAARARGP